jgi:ribonuclease P protein component
VVVHLLRTESRGPARVGFAVSRAVGGAVVRNRVKRQLRHAMRSLLASLPSGGLVVVRALPEAATSDYPRLADDLGRCVSRAAEDRA